MRLSGIFCSLIIGLWLTAANAAYIPFPGAATPTNILSVFGDNATSIKGSSGTVYAIFVANTTAQTVYLKFYNTASTPSCASTTVVTTIPIQPNAPFSLALPYGINFTTGIGLCLVAGVANNDDTPITDGVIASIFWL